MVSRKNSRGRTSSVKDGYEKLAFGGVNDAVLLMAKKDLTPAEIKKLDLYGVAEIEQRKDGIHMKFYDRMKALECLKKLEESGAEQSPLYRAVMRSVRKDEGESEDGV